MAILDMKNRQDPQIGSFVSVEPGSDALLEGSSNKTLGSDHLTGEALSIERIQDINELEAIHEEWNGLFDNTEVKTVEMSYLWQVTYWKHFHEDSELYVLVVKRSNFIIAIVPLKLSVKHKLGLKTRTLEIIAASESNYQDLVIGEKNKAVLDCLFDYLLEQRDLWDILVLGNISEFSETSLYLLGRLNKSLLNVIINKDKCIYYQSENSSLQGTGSSEANGFIHRKLARALRRLSKDLGEVQLSRYQSQEQLKVGLSQFFDLHRKRWNDTEWPSQFNDVRFCQFYMEVVPELFALHQVELFSLQAGKTQLGQALDFMEGRSAVGQLMAYDIAFSKYSPMRLLLGLKMNELISHGIDFVDYGSYQPYKEEWTNRIKTRISFKFYPHRLYPSVVFLVARLYDSLLAQVRNMPGILNFAKAVRRNVRLFFRPSKKNR